MTSPDLAAVAASCAGLFTPAEAQFDARIDVDRAHWTALAAELATTGLELSDLTALDPGEGRLEIVAWLLASPTLQVRIGTLLTDDDLSVGSLTGVFPSAEWPEREVFDLFGVTFRGHPDLTRILLPDDAAIHPLRKSFTLEERPW